jgi:hypothetical protein
MFNLLHVLIKNIKYYIKYERWKVSEFNFNEEHSSKVIYLFIFIFLTRDVFWDN